MLSQVELIYLLHIQCSHQQTPEMNVPEISLHVNNAPLTNIYPNTIETCLTPSHLLFGRELLYSSNTTSTVVTNLTVLPNTADKIKCISNHFGDR